jgi:hypothetical protein
MYTGIPDSLVRDLLPLLRRFCIGEYGIAAGGSRVKGIGDEQSDVDVYLFTADAFPPSDRSAWTEQALGPAAQTVSWELSDVFVEGGTDFWYRGQKVETWLRNARRVETTLAACLAGEIRRDCVAWTVMGFYNYVILSDIHVMQIVEDPYGILARWKAQVAEYPRALRQAIVGRYLREAKFWPENFHYRSAVERADVIYTAGIVQQVLYALIQVVFALNEVYFPGEKKLAVTLEKLKAKPPGFTRRVQELMYPGQNPSVAQLRAQRAALSALVNAVEQLVSA